MGYGFALGSKGLSSNPRLVLFSLLYVGHIFSVFNTPMALSVRPQPTQVPPVKISLVFNMGFSEISLSLGELVDENVFLIY